MRVIHKKTSKITEIIKNHIKENIKAYVIVSIILLVGIALGVIFVNNMNDFQVQNIQSYLIDFVNSINNGAKINSGELLRKSLINSFLLVIFMWFVGSTVIGIPVVIGMVMFRGFCIGYTISASILTWGNAHGILFFTTSMLLQNLIFIPCIIALAVSGIKLYKSIMKDKHKENIKIEIFRHTIFSLFILVVLIVSSFIETYISTNLLMMCISYFVT